MTRLIYIVDDDPNLRENIDRDLSNLGYRTRLFGSGSELLSAGKLRRGCILLDAHMPVMDGFEVHDELLRRGIDLPVIFLDGDVPLAVRAMQRGAVDFLEKPFTMGELVPVIERALLLAAQGEEARETRAEAVARLQSLTPRGTQILQGMQAGMANKSIARWLDLSPRTVEVYRATMMAKIGVTRLSQALRVASDGGLPPIPAIEEDERRTASG